MNARVITMSNVLDKTNDDWIVEVKTYNINKETFDLKSRIVSTRYIVENVKELPQEKLKKGRIVKGFITSKSKFLITEIN